MFCSVCGKQNPEGAKFCAGCGSPLEATPAQPTAQPAAQPAPAPQTPTPAPSYTYQAQPVQTAPVVYPAAGVQTMSSTDQTLRLIAFILGIVSCVVFCWAVIPLAWLIPMTVHTWGIYKGRKNNTVAFGVCTLIFCNLIGGILLLVSTKDA